MEEKSEEFVLQHKLGRCIRGWVAFVTRDKYVMIFLKWQVKWARRGPTSALGQKRSEKCAHRNTFLYKAAVQICPNHAYKRKKPFRKWPRNYRTAVSAFASKDLQKLQWFFKSRCEAQWQCRILPLIKFFLYILSQNFKQASKTANPETETYKQNS